MNTQSRTVLQLLPEMEVGGVEQGTLEIASALVKAGHRALVVSGGGRLVPQLEAAGAIGAELEVVPDRVATEISKRTTLVMLSMGSGSGGDAQYLFAEDVLGYTRGHRPRHAKVYRNFRAELDRLQRERIAAFGEFRADVASGIYPGREHVVTIDDREFEAFVMELT